MVDGRGVGWKRELMKRVLGLECTKIAETGVRKKARWRSLLGGKLWQRIDK